MARFALRGIFPLVWVAALVALTPSASAAELTAAAVRQQLEMKLPGVAGSIQATEEHGRVTLDGSVSNFLEKEMATDVVARMSGVNTVVNRLRIHAEPRPDKEIADNVRWVLRNDPATSTLDIKASAHAGVVTLEGRVDTVPQKRLAAWIAGERIGVTEVQNNIRVVPESRSDDEIRRELTQHYQDSAIFRGEPIVVEVHNGVVTLSGRVHTAMDKNWAQTDAWVPGVRQVKIDGIEVHPEHGARNGAEELTDEEIRRAIVREFVFDPRVYSFKPEVTVKDHIVTLDGEVTNRKAREAALQLARSISGVTVVINRLKLEPAKRGDEDLLRDIRTSLNTSAALADDAVTASATNGAITLEGRVDSYYEKWLAGDLADRLPGVKEVDNRLEVIGAVPTFHTDFYYYPGSAVDHPAIHSFSPDSGNKADHQLEKDVRVEMQWDPYVDQPDIRIRARDGIVTLTGRVDSWTECAEAIDSAYRAGARRVTNNLTIAAHNAPRDGGATSGS